VFAVASNSTHDIVSECGRSWISLNRVRQQQCNMHRICRCCCCITVAVVLLSVNNNSGRELKCNRNRKNITSGAMSRSPTNRHEPMSIVLQSMVEIISSASANSSSVFFFVSLNPSGYFLQLSRTNLVGWTRGCRSAATAPAQSDATSNILRVPILLVILGKPPTVKNIWRYIAPVSPSFRVGLYNRIPCMNCTGFHKNLHVD
jgi:hypothetical protein